VETAIDGFFPLKRRPQTPRFSEGAGHRISLRQMWPPVCSLSSVGRLGRSLNPAAASHRGRQGGPAMWLDRAGHLRSLGNHISHRGHSANDLIFRVLGREEEPNPRRRLADRRIENRLGIDAPLQQQL
jgi:hypothetical protein